MAAFWAVFTFGGSGPALTAHGLLDLKQEIQIQSTVRKAKGKNSSGAGGRPDLLWIFLCDVTV
jgi:hypothetical protein